MEGKKIIEKCDHPFVKVINRLLKCDDLDEWELLVLEDIIACVVHELPYRLPSFGEVPEEVVEAMREEVSRRYSLIYEAKYSAESP